MYPYKSSGAKDRVVAKELKGGNRVEEPFLGKGTHALWGDSFHASAVLAALTGSHWSLEERHRAPRPALYL